MTSSPKSPRDPARVTMRVLAKMAGVSVQSVSLALRNQPSIGRETRGRIQALARKLGYTPDPALVKLMHHLRARQQRKIAASVCFLTTRSPRAEDIFCDLLLEGAIAAAQQAGFSYQVAHVDPEKPSGDQFKRMLRARGVEGLLLMPMADVRPLDALVDWREFSVVAATRSVTSPVFDQVVPDHFRNVSTICQHLKAAGFRRPGLVIEWQHDVRCGYLLTAAMAWHGVYGGLSPARAHRYERLEPEAFRRWLREEKPDVLLAALDRVAGDIHESMPEGNLPVVTCSARPTSAGTFPLSGTFDSPRQIGVVATEILARKIAVGQRGIPAQPNTTLISGEWVNGSETDERLRALAVPPGQHRAPAVTRSRPRAKA
jgi:DNA-binding LacI/PurR family transcriptional regulator